MALEGTGLLEAWRTTHDLTAGGRPTFWQLYVHGQRCPSSGDFPRDDSASSPSYGLSTAQACQVFIKVNTSQLKRASLWEGEAVVNSEAGLIILNCPKYTRGLYILLKI